MLVSLYSLRNNHFNPFTNKALIHVHLDYSYLTSMLNHKSLSVTPIEEFLDWIAKVEKSFKKMEIPENKQVLLVAKSPKWGPFAWWLGVKMSRAYEHKNPVWSWPKIKKLLRARFLPPNYEHDQEMFRQCKKCQKDQKVVNQYVNKFNRQSSCYDILVSKL